MLTKLGVRPGWYLVAGLVVLAAMVAAPTKPASATTYTVTKTEDTADGICNADCSLREAIIAANGNAGRRHNDGPCGDLNAEPSRDGRGCGSNGRPGRHRRPDHQRRGRCPDIGTPTGGG